MPAVPRRILGPVVRLTVKPAHRLPPRLRRGVFEALGRVQRAPGGVKYAGTTRGGVEGELASPRGMDEAPRILYLHGGAYEVGSPRLHRALVGTLAAATGRTVFSCDYRLAPEHPAPAALEDVLAAYEAMVADVPEGIVIAGDSAGGGLSVAAAGAARDRDLLPPLALALICPWVDLRLEGASHRENRRRDALLATGRPLERAAHGYAATLGIDDPVCSPLRADLHGLPPTLIHAAGNDVLRSDAEALEARMREAGVEVELRVFADLWHDFHMHAGTLREADRAVGELADWIGARLA